MKKENVTQVILTGEEKAIQDLKKKMLFLNVQINLIPTIEFKKCTLNKSEQQALTQLPSYDYLFFTSVRAVEYFIDALTEQQIDRKKITFPPAVAVGPMTARACEDVGLSVVSTPAHFTADHMIKELPQLRGKKILFPRSSIAPEDTIVSINNSGAEVTQLSLYNTIYRVEELGEADEVALANAEYVIFLSPSSVKSFINCVSDSTLTNVLRTVTAVCIGPRTKKTARTLGFEQIVISNEFTTDGVIDTLRTVI